MSELILIIHMLQILSVVIWGILILVIIQRCRVIGRREFIMVLISIGQIAIAACGLIWEESPKVMSPPELDALITFRWLMLIAGIINIKYYLEDK